MNLYFAPLEGISALRYRNAHAEFFGGCDAYYAPFISPSEQDKVNKKGIVDILPENNMGVNLKAQVLTRDSEAFLKFADKIKNVGYDEVNINIGCPAGTVVKKGRGAGFLKEPEKIDEFLFEVFSKSPIKISVKTRIGFSDENEIFKLMEVYNKYPLELLIIHPRTREDLYNGTARVNVFKEALKISKNKVCYNGDIFSVSDYNKIVKECPGIEGVMIGRGALKNPAIFRSIRGGAPITRDELLMFSEKLMKIYDEGLRSEVYTLHKMKEIWRYMILNFPDDKKINKAIKKARTINEFEGAVSRLPEIKE